MKVSLTLIALLTTLPTYAAESPVPAPSYSFFGDIRHRYEAVESEQLTGTKSNRYDQMRLRVRVGVKGQPTPQTHGEVRLATGPGGVSTNETYGENPKGMKNYQFNLDRGFLRYSPAAFFSLSGGRMGNPFLHVADNDLMFDADQNFDGTSVAFEHRHDRFSLFLIAGQFILDESKNADPTTDVKMNSAQIGGRWKTDGYSFGLVLSNHQLSGIKDHSSFSGTDFHGNTSSAGKYAHDYGISSVGVDVTAEWKIPVTLYYEAIRNAGPDAEQAGSILGLKINKLKDAGDMFFAIDTRELQKDATLGLLTDGDSFGGGTNGRGVRATAAYGITKSFNLQLSYFSGVKNIAPGETSTTANKAQFDLNFKF